MDGAVAGAEEDEPDPRPAQAAGDHLRIGAAFEAVAPLDLGRQCPGVRADTLDVTLQAVAQRVTALDARPLSPIATPSRRPTPSAMKTATSERAW